MNKVELVVFDMDGLLIDSERGMWLVNEKRSIEELGFVFSYELITSLAGASVQEYKKRITKYYGKEFDVEKYYQMVYDYNQVMIDNNEITLMKGSIELLEFLKANNIKARIATSTPKHIALQILNNLKLTNYFEKIITGDQVENGKPAPDIYNLAIGDTNKDNTLIFEDGHNGSRAAIASGANLIIVPDIAMLTDEDKKEAFKVIESLDKAINIIKEINNIE